MLVMGVLCMTTILISYIWQIVNLQILEFLFEAVIQNMLSQYGNKHQNCTLGF